MRGQLLLIFRQDLTTLRLGFPEQGVSLTLDRCRTALINETEGIGGKLLTEERTSCEVHGVIMQDRRFWELDAILQLGGVKQSSPRSHNLIPHKPFKVYLRNIVLNKQVMTFYHTEYRLPLTADGCSVADMGSVDASGKSASVLWGSLSRGMRYDQVYDLAAPLEAVNSSPGCARKGTACSSPAPCDSPCASDPWTPSCDCPPAHQDCGKGCIKNARLNGCRLPMENTTASPVSVISREGVTEGCVSDVCSSSPCSRGFVCVDLWMSHECRYHPTRAGVTRLQKRLELWGPTLCFLSIPS
ncbi:uncharacterized protein LOC128468009 [Spea bombifrons]|uniref:uncharacterized protein LOC128468009 n=1 Tax=Spea bombifrons TaxID=233779 RepID=UPI00234BD569|nr:uncharacterized protein LOC128468009 [Spea bombifrons]